MTFSFYENSIFGGQPVELYHFSSGVDNWYFTSAEKAITHEAATYQPAVLKRSKISQSTEINKNPVKLTAPRDFVISELFRASPPPGVVNLTIRRRHRNDTDNEALIIWIARVLDCSWKKSASTLNTESVFTAVKRTGLHRNAQKPCSHTLYDGECGLANTSFKGTGTVSAISGKTITASFFSSQADGKYSGGYITFLKDGATHQRTILSHTGSDVTLLYEMEALSVNDTIIGYLGCNRTLATCVATFGNEINYGGMPYLPPDTPFGGKKVF